jgi:hypothetical protein
MEENKKTPQEVVVEVQKQIDEILKANNCIIDVEAKPSNALGRRVIVFDPVIIYKGEK